MKPRPRAPGTVDSLVDERENPVAASMPATSSLSETGSVHIAETPDRRVGSDDDARAVDALVQRLALEYPGMVESEVKQLIACCLEATSTARDQRFRLMLAERAVRRHLRHRRGSHGQATKDSSAGTPGSR